MTKLVEWLLGLTVFVSAWSWLMTDGAQKSLGLQHYSEVVLFLPLFAVLTFGVYAVSVVVWRVYCFNDCPEAAKELQRQIKEAKDELRKKGLSI